MAGLLVAALFVVLGWYCAARFLATPDATPALVLQTVGFVDTAKVRAAHPAYEKLSELNSRRHILKSEIAELLKEPLIVKPPEATKEPFDDSVWQKNAQNVISQRAEIERKRKKATEEYRQETDAAFRERRSAIDGEYLNEILNIRLKLQNADIMRLSADEVAALNKEMEVLQKERGKRQIALNEEREAEIAAFAEKVVLAEIGDWRDNLEKSKAALVAEAAKRQADAAARNAAAMDEQMKISRRRQEAIKKKRELILLEGQIARIEKRIAADIEGRVAKLAIMHSLPLVFAAPPAELRENSNGQRFFDGVFSVGNMREYTAVIPAADTIDLTDEAVREMSLTEYTDDDKSVDESVDESIDANDAESDDESEFAAEADEDSPENP